MLFNHFHASYQRTDGFNFFTFALFYADAHLFVRLSILSRDLQCLSICLHRLPSHEERYEIEMEAVEAKNLQELGKRIQKALDKEFKRGNKRKGK